MVFISYNHRFFSQWPRIKCCSLNVWMDSHVVFSCQFWFCESRASYFENQSQSQIIKWRSFTPALYGLCKWRLKGALSLCGYFFSVHIDLFGVQSPGAEWGFIFRGRGGLSGEARGLVDEKKKSTDKECILLSQVCVGYIWLKDVIFDLKCLEVSEILSYILFLASHSLKCWREWARN